ncbi:uncharacterized protein B0H18DRAFT_1123102 [Fomitopsis serialis]|uniref:uncharacterized protein n=1 Tax=Fomitopsis serialis TaxID=139415 RepID=UPI002007A94E|nr:uncharacterized protein B0H18DRAFT_1123102 [Neoantrodia serialis]KAH9918319.1 hypothetical protein B0H18DRAFT_1123102 [Neoantrodia serialis]
MSQLYDDEAHASDSDMGGSWKDSIEVFLLFLGWAILRRCHRVSYFLAELIAVKRAAASGAPSDDMKPSSALRTTSLTIVLSSALIAPDLALVRQHRFMGLQTRRVPVIIDILPTFLHLALFLLFAGFALFFCHCMPVCLVMRYSTIASAALLAVATAPALAHPVTIRATEDASMVERELQVGLLERGYYANVLPRDRKTSDGSCMWAPRLRTTPGSHAATNPPPNRAGPNGRPHPQPNGGSGHNGGAGRGAGAPHRRREYDLDGELFERGFEIDELD